MRILSPDEIRAQIETLARDGYCAKPQDIAKGGLYQLRAPERLSTIEFAEKHHYVRSSDGASKVLWSLKRTPYMKGPMEALDDPRVREVILPKPGRSGGTAALEAYEHKLLEHGPQVDMLIYLGSGSEVASYARRGFRWLFEDHPALKAKIGPTRSDNQATRKTVAGRLIELIAFNETTTTGREAPWIRVDECDSIKSALTDTVLQTVRERQRQIGNVRKAGIVSHADRGWEGGVARAWSLSSRGIFVMQCMNCGRWASPYPTKFWEDVPRFRLEYDVPRDTTGKPIERASLADRVKVAGDTAAMTCPHCRTGLDDDQRRQMVAEGVWMHSGQSLDIEVGVIGEIDDNPARGFWIHGLMIGQVSNRELAQALEAGRDQFRRTKRATELIKVIVRTFGEVWEGTAGSDEMNASVLQKRVKAQPDILPRGIAPDEGRFVTAAVDVGGKKFDVMLQGWDVEGRSWVIDRFTIKSRLVDGIMRDVKPAERIEDWTILEEQVVDRLVPVIGTDTALPVALTLIDSGDGNVTWKAYEFARRMAGKRWGMWERVRCLKGRNGKHEPVRMKADEAQDNRGKPLRPRALRHLVGVDGIRETIMGSPEVVGRITIDDGSPGQIMFYDGFERTFIDEIFAERLTAGKWHRHGDNETLDLLIYNEAARLLLNPDRQDRDWTPGKEPTWARRIPLIVNAELKGGDLSAEAKAASKLTVAERAKMFMPGVRYG